MFVWNWLRNDAMSIANNRICEICRELVFEGEATENANEQTSRE